MAGNIRLSGNYYRGLWREQVISGHDTSGNTLISGLSQNFVMGAHVGATSARFQWYKALGTPIDDVNIATLNPLMVLDHYGYLGLGVGLSPRASLDVGGSALFSGNVGIGTTSPTARLHIENEANTYELRLNNTFGPGASLAFHQNGTTRGGMGVTGRWKGDTSSDLGIWAEDGGRLAFYADGNAVEKLTIATDGNVGIGTTAPGANLEVNGGAAEGRIKVTGGGNGYTQADILLQSSTSSSPEGRGLGIYAFNEGTDANWFWGNPYNQPDTFVINRKAGTSFDVSSAERANSLMTVNSSGNVGIGTTAPQAKLHVSGEILTNAVNITAGADIAEPFPVTGPDIPKGAVVVIDDTQPGQLKLSERAYDTRVAGIVSGAGGVNSGLTLRQEGVLEGTHNVALTGRVYALADASTGPIKPGDMLTTSDTPGHVMKAADRAKAYGAVIGKAMTPLNQGQGLVLVLVSLQ